MIIRKFFKLSVICLAMLSCGRKTPGDSVQVTRSASGAAAVDPANTEAALMEASAMGVQIDILEAQKVHLFDGSIHVTTTLLINGSTKLPIYTDHLNTNIVTGSVVWGDLDILVSSRCPNSQCDPLYFMIDVSKGGRRVIQEGMVKSFNGSRGDFFHWNSPYNWMSFENMVSYITSLSP